MTRAKRIIAWGLFALVLMVISGLLLADHLTPPATGAPSRALAVRPAQTALDRELVPLLAANPGKTGVLMVPDGLDAFAARAISARRAGRSLDLQYYIWHDDLTGRLLGREAWLAAERGVRVRMLLDDMNAEGLDSKLLLLDTHPNIEIRLYNPFRNRTGVWRVLELVQRIFSVNHRMHNKAWIADGRVAVVGGRNIGAEYFSAGEQVNFRDLDRQQHLRRILEQQRGGAAGGADGEASARAAGAAGRHPHRSPQQRSAALSSPRRRLAERARLRRPQADAGLERPLARACRPATEVETR